jgi:hypothetical protein
MSSIAFEADHLCADGYFILRILGHGEIHLAPDGGQHAGKVDECSIDTDVLRQSLFDNDLSVIVLPSDTYRKRDYMSRTLAAILHRFFLFQYWFDLDETGAAPWFRAEEVYQKLIDFSQQKYGRDTNGI